MTDLLRVEDLWVRFPRRGGGMVEANDDADELTLDTTAAVLEVLVAIADAFDREIEEVDRTR